MRKFLKRLFDILFGLILGCIAIPILLLVMLFVFLVSPSSGSPIFKQVRVGYKGKQFTMLKLRTMTNKKDENGDLLPDEERLKWWGRVIRKTNIDELAQILHILIGQMSFIGPRPLLTKYLPYYSQQERLRHSVRPGLTGYAQVHGRNAVSWEKRFEYDVWYVQHLSLLTDIKIILDTVRVVLTHDGVELNSLEDFDEYRKKQSVSDIQT